MNKSKKINIRLSEKELDKIKELSEKSGMSISQYIRFKCIDEKK